MWSVFGSQNLPLPPRIYPLFNKYMRPSQNILLPPRIYPPFQQLYATLPKSTPTSQNIGPTLLFNSSMRPSKNIPPPFSTTICDPPRFYPSLPECTPFSMSTICDPPTIYPSLPEYTTLFNNYMRPSQNLLIPPRIYPHFQQLQDYATPPESAPPS